MNRTRNRNQMCQYPFSQIKLQREEIDSRNKLVGKLEAKLASVEKKYQELEAHFIQLQRYNLYYIR